MNINTQKWQALNQGNAIKFVQLILSRIFILQNKMSKNLEKIMIILLKVRWRYKMRIFLMLNLQYQKILMMRTTLNLHLSYSKEISFTKNNSSLLDFSINQFKIFYFLNLHSMRLIKNGFCSKMSKIKITKKCIL